MNRRLNPELTAYLILTINLTMRKVAPTLVCPHIKSGKLSEKGLKAVGQMHMNHA